jgi:hypothetical protein
MTRTLQRSGDVSSLDRPDDAARGTPLPSSLKQAVKRAVPLRWHPAELARRKVARVARGTVLAGPFRGMRLINSPEDFVDYTMLLGTYELELHPFVEQIRRARFRSIIEVGAAQGYYAVGLAMLCPESDIVAFECNPAARDQLWRAARANGVVDKIALRGHCRAEDLRACLHDPAHCLVFMDIDGGEFELLDPGRIAELRSTCILLEEHECFLPGIIATIEARFRHSHIIERVDQRARSLRDLCVRSRLLDPWLLKLMHERPPGNSWIYMKPRTQAAS